MELVGPGYGYFPQARKTVLIVKEKYLENAKAKKIFSETGIHITTQGQRHLGAAIGCTEFREKYVSSLVNEWVKKVELLAEYGKSEPNASYCAFTFGLVHKWGYFQMTIPDSASYYIPLETAIREKFIPAITGKSCSDLERDIVRTSVQTRRARYSKSSENGTRVF